MTINLAPDRFDKSGEHQSLGELHDNCADILRDPNIHLSLNEHRRDVMHYISKRAIRAVCEEILRTGSLPTPLEVSFTHFWQQPASSFDFQPGRN
jgi:hypothetical protein